MAGNTKVAVLVGSLRKGAYSRMVAEALIALAPPTLECEIVEIGQLPLYSQDYDNDPPVGYAEFRSRISEAQAFLFVTPEHNRTFTAALKNAVDIGSRPYGKNAWSGKPGAVVSVTPGALGAFGANHHLRQALVAVGVATMVLPEAYIAKVAELLDDRGQLVDDKTKQYFAAFMASFEAWIKKLS